MRCLFAVLTLLALATAASAEPAANREPLKIKSDTLQADNDKKSATFEGKVVARQGDLTLYADRLVITNGADGHELSRVEAFGNVRGSSGSGMEFTTSRVSYVAARSQLESSEAVRFQDGGLLLEGVGMEFQTQTRRLKLMKDVSAVYQPQGAR